MIHRFIDAVSVIIVACAVLFAAWAFIAGQRGNNEIEEVQFGRISIPPDVLEASATGQRLGPADAPVTILVFWDYGCSFCREFDESLQRLLARYPQHVAVVVKHFVPLQHSPSTRLVLAAECAGAQGVFGDFTV